MWSVNELYSTLSGSRIPPGTYNTSNGSYTLISGDTFSVTFTTPIDTLPNATKHFEVGYPLEILALWEQV